MEVSTGILSHPELDTTGTKGSSKSGGKGDEIDDNDYENNKETQASESKGGDENKSYIVKLEEFKGWEMDLFK